MLAVVTNTSPSGKEEVSLFHLHFARYTLLGMEHLVTLAAWLSEAHGPF